MGAFTQSIGWPLIPSPILPMANPVRLTITKYNKQNFFTFFKSRESKVKKKLAYVGYSKGLYNFGAGSCLEYTSNLIHLLKKIAKVFLNQ